MRASRAARAAWERTSAQLSFDALEEAESPDFPPGTRASVGLAAGSVSSSASDRAPSRQGALANNERDGSPSPQKNLPSQRRSV